MNRVIAIVSLCIACTCLSLQAQTQSDILFIHHSCGSNWLSASNGGLSTALAAKDYIDTVNDITYGDDLTPDSGRPDSLASTPGDKTNMNHWVYWFNDYLEGVQSFPSGNGYNKIIMFKSCYPISNVTSDGSTPGDPFSSSQTLTNYKAVYQHPDGSGNTYASNGAEYLALEDIFAANPDILFIPVTAPPLCNTSTNDANAHRARLFNTWLTDEWQVEYKQRTGLNNVAVFDWFNVLANADDAATMPNRLKAEYGGETTNSHPNQTANVYSTEVFAGRANNFIDQAYAFFFDPLSGDLNGDGFVGLDDLDIVLANWNQSVPPADQRADVSGPTGAPDGYIGLDDLDVVLNNWNAGTPPISENTNTIPEPGTIMLLSAACLITNKRRAHR